MAKSKKSPKTAVKTEVKKEEVKVEENEEVEVVEVVKEVESNEFDILKSFLVEIQEKVNTIDEVSIKELLKLKKELNTLTKNTINHSKKVEKVFNKNSNSKKKRKSTTSGFDKPIVLSGPAKTFITKHCKGEVTNTLSRREVNKYIHTYIKGNNLQNPENRRQIKPDTHLKKILSELSSEKNKNGTVDSEQGYTYFNLQKYIKHIFIQQ